MIQAYFTQIKTLVERYAIAPFVLDAAVVFCQPVKVDYTIVGGKLVVKDGNLVKLEIGKLVEQHNKAAKRLFN